MARPSRLLSPSTLGNNGAADGAAGEGDDIQADVERAVGGTKADTMIGNDLANRLTGGSADTISGRGAADTLLGGSGYDKLKGKRRRVEGRHAELPDDTVRNCD